MTPSEINAAIATWMGWMGIHLPSNLAVPPSTHQLDQLEEIPNYHGDLNACASFEAKLSDGDQAFYTHHIVCMTVWLKNPENDNSKIRWALMTATAPQRAEALLRTIGKWKE